MGDIIYSRQNSDGTFQEKWLTPSANQFVICGPCGDLTTSTGSGDTITSQSIVDLLSMASDNNGGSFLVDGGNVTWVENYEYIVSPAYYYILGNRYTSSYADITLPIADPTYDRIDVVAVTTASTVIVIEGEASADPVRPDIEYPENLELTFIYVTANTTSPPSSSNKIIYQENLGLPTEWNAASNNATINVNSTNNPRTGTKCIEATLATNLHTASFVTSSLYTSYSNSSLSFWIRSKSAWPSAKYMQLAWFNGNTRVGSYVRLDDGLLGFNSALINVYQPIIIPMSSFRIPDLYPINGLRIEVRGGGSGIGWYIDDIVFSTGLTPEQSQDELVKVTLNDVAGGYLQNKLIAGPNIYISRSNAAGYERLHISSSATGEFDDSHLVTTKSFNEWTGSPESQFAGTASYTKISETASYGLYFSASNHMVVFTGSNDSLGYIDLYGGMLYGTSSWAISASWAPMPEVDLSAYLSSSEFNNWTGSTDAQFSGTSSFSISSSWASNGGTLLTTGSTYPITASWSESSSFSETTRYIKVLNSGIYGGAPDPAPNISPSIFSTDNNTSFGIIAMDELRSGSYNTAIGYSTMIQETVDTTETPIYNTAIGAGALNRIAGNGEGNSALGAFAGSEVAESAVSRITHCTFLGYNTPSNRNMSPGFTASVAIGSFASILKSREMVVGAPSTNPNYSILTFRPGMDNNTDLGSGSFKFKDIYFSGTAYGTASHAVSASYALNAGSGGTLLTTGSTYPFTSSWAVNATNWNSSSIISLINTKQNQLGTGSIYPITSSWANNWNSASVITLIGTKQNTIVTGSLIPITSSWTNNWNSSSLISLINTKQNIIATGSLLPVTSSWAVNWNSASVITLINTKQNTIATGSLLPITSSWATNVVNNGTSLTTGSTYPITSSWASTSSFTQNSLVSDFALLAGEAINVTTASYATTASHFNQLWLATGSTYPITSSWSGNTNTASFVLATTDTIITSKNNVNAFVISGSTTTRIGEYAGASATTATNATMIGAYAGYSATNATNATMIGRSAGSSATTASNATLIGHSAGQNATTATDATMLGYFAGQNATTATNATLIGRETGRNATTATNTTMLGFYAGRSATTATNATLIGAYVGENATNATNATMIGYAAGYRATNAANATMVGYYAGDNATTASNATMLGHYAGQSATTATDATMLGYFAGQSATTATNATLIGGYAGQLATTATNATMIGSFAGRNATTATNATIIGRDAGRYATTATNATMLGRSAGYNASTGSNSTFIGAYADAATSQSNVEKSVAIGYNAHVSGPNMMVLGGVGADALNVGINTENPTNRLEVVGNVVATSFTGSLQGTSSWAVSSSYAPMPKIKAGIVSGSFFGGTTDLTSSVSFTTPFVNSIYSVVVTGEDPRTWYVESKDENGFIINSNSNVVFSGNVYWQAIYMGEYQ